MAKTITNARVLGIVQAMQSLLSTTLPVRSALKVRQIARQLQVQAQDLDSVRMSLLEKHGKRDESGQLVTSGEGATKVVVLDPEKEAAFTAEFEELMAQTFELATTLNIEDLGPDFTVTPLELAAGLADILTDED